MRRRDERGGSPSRTLLAGAMLVALCAPHAALAQKLGQGGDDGISLWRVMAALLLCLALAVAGALALKARSGGAAWPLRFILPRAGRQARRMQIVESMRLSHQVDLYIVTCDNRDLLIAVNSQGAQILERLGPHDGAIMKRRDEA